MAPSDCWRSETWSFVQEHLPAAPARVVELGCGRHGGLVPHLVAAGYDALGVDPEAPDGARYVRAAFEDADVQPPAAVVVACVSLHHVDDLDQVMDRIAAALAPSGTVVVVEWGWERFDEPTARWCFDRLPSGWLEHRRQGWIDSGLPWKAYLRQWATTEGMHTATDILDALGRRFSRTSLDEAPYFFCDLAETSREAERAAIETGVIRGTGLRYAGILA